MTRNELSELMTDLGYEDSIVFENPSYIDAIIGYSDSGRVCYDFEKMIESAMKNSDMTYEEAIEFIEYNTIRSLPYQSSEKRPIIIYPFAE